ncbi:hypothetical protein [Miniphocaeibacter halophilus]|uniref:Uncharacterized protein n=1 Tax=Miniphocaeibacter halophilus TaxID=2931922 RepID=A0AC61MSD3_9FIRM|nr:hypothetical protein [Miniphocaeibacter halophilus]QQK07106.1 hypothetical protein JFY71_07155 [Miniphocaeibacter halophilus]
MNIIEIYELENFENIFKSSTKALEKYNSEKIKLDSGIVEATNMIIYLAKNNKDYSSIFNKELNEENYLEIIEELGRYIGKRTISVLQMNRGIKKYTGLKGKKLHLMKNYWKWNNNSVYEYIKSGIFSNSPVLMITWNFKDKDIQNRWFCIIGMKKYDNGKVELIATTGKEKKILDLNSWLEGKSLYKGLIYYK